MRTINSFEDLDVWQKAHQLVMAIYKLTLTYPNHERYCLVKQMRRAAVSIPANIAEGFKRRGLKDKAHFYNISQGSLEELRYYLFLSKELNYIQDYPNERELANHTARMLNALILSVLGKQSKAS